MDLVLVASPSWHRTTSSRRRRLFSPRRGRVGLPLHRRRSALFVEKGRRGRAEAVRAVVAAGASIAAHDPQRLVQCVDGHWHAIVIGRPADRGSASRDQRFRRRSRAKRNRVTPEVVQHEVSVSLGIVGHNGWGTPDKTLPRPRDIM